MKRTFDGAISSARFFQPRIIAIAAMLFVSATGIAQTAAVLYRFTGFKDGAGPRASLLRDAQGNLYGTTSGSNTFAGTVFELTVSGTEKTLETYGGTDSSDAGLIRDGAGNFYGTTYYGGIYGGGSIFEITPGGTVKLLYSFSGMGDGGSPTSTLLRDEQGNLYGTALYGNVTSSLCSFGCGEIFELSAAGDFTVLYSFTGLADGRDPVAGLVRDGRGDLYGTTYYGGNTECAANFGCGVVFELSPTGALTVLHNFNGDGAGPAGPLLRDAQGTLYGTTSNDNNSSGTVFAISSTGSFTTLFSFDGENGGSPWGALVMDADGNLYGTTLYGGSSSCGGGGGCGVVYKLTPSGMETVLHKFSGPPDGRYPQAGLVMDAQGNLYGTTVIGGLITGECSGGCGTVFKVTP